MLRVELSGDSGPRHEAVVTIRAVTLASRVTGKLASRVPKNGCDRSDVRRRGLQGGVGGQAADRVKVMGGRVTAGT